MDQYIVLDFCSDGGWLFYRNFRGTTKHVGTLFKMARPSGVGIRRLWTFMAIHIDGNLCALGNHHLPRCKACAGFATTMGIAQLARVCRGGGSVAADIRLRCNSPNQLCDC